MVEVGRSHYCGGDLCHPVVQHTQADEMMLRWSCKLRQGMLLIALRLRRN